MSNRLTMVIGVHLVLRQGYQVLLARRFNTGFADGSYNFPCGHLDDNEDAVAGLIREMREEIGITIRKNDLRFIGATHWHSNKQSVNLFFECRKWSGKPKNGEPDKCDDVAWFKMDKSPRKMVAQTKKVLAAISKKQIPFFIEYKAGK